MVGFYIGHLRWTTLLIYYYGKFFLRLSQWLVWLLLFVACWSYDEAILFVISVCILVFFSLVRRDAASVGITFSVTLSLFFCCHLLFYLVPTLGTQVLSCINPNISTCSATSWFNSFRIVQVSSITIEMYLLNVCRSSVCPQSFSPSQPVAETSGSRH